MDVATILVDCTAGTGINEKATDSKSVKQRIWMRKLWNVEHGLGEIGELGNIEGG